MQCCSEHFCMLANQLSYRPEKLCWACVVTYLRGRCDHDASWSTCIDLRWYQWSLKSMPTRWIQSEKDPNLDAVTWGEKPWQSDARTLTPIQVRVFSHLCAAQKEEQHTTCLELVLLFNFCVFSCSVLLWKSSPTLIATVTECMRTLLRSCKCAFPPKKRRSSDRSSFDPPLLFWLEYCLNKS